MTAATIDHTLLRLRDTAGTWTAMCACGWAGTTDQKSSAIAEHVLHVRREGRDIRRNSQ